MTSKLSTLRISDDRRSICIPLTTGEARFHAVWLRDNADVVMHAEGQKKSTILACPENVTIGTATIGEDGLAITFQPENLQCQFPLPWLDAHRYDQTQSSASAVGHGAHIAHWDAQLNLNTVTSSYRSVLEDKQALLQWLSCVATYGFGILKDLAGTPGEILDVTALFGYPRETNYGKVFDVRSEINPANLAYSNLGLQAHTDNPYRDPVPTLQILSCLENSAEGGLSVVVDGFKAASILQEENPRHFELLSQYKAEFLYSGHGEVKLSASKPMLELDIDGFLQSVRFNNRSLAPLTKIPFEVMQHYYEAYRHFAEIIERDNLSVSFKLAAGELFMVNNQRVLHGRTSYDSAGKRWLQGCYPDIDGLYSTMGLLQRELNMSVTA